MNPAEKRFPRAPGLPGKGGVVLGLVALGVFAAARRAPAQTEIAYGRGLYPLIADELARASSLVSFSLAEWVFALIVLSLLLAAPRGYLRARRSGRGLLFSLLAGCTKLLGRIGAWWFLFVALWGLNYARPAPEIQFALQAPPPAAREAALVASIGERLDLLRAHVAEGVDHVTATSADLGALDEHLRSRQAVALRDAGFPPIEHGRVKKLLASPLLMRWGLSGIYGPFTGEPNIVWPAPPALAPFTLAHERAHLSGFAREDAAGFVAMLTCWRSEQPEVRYSAWLSLYLALRQDVKQRSEGVRRDIEALHRFVQQHRGPEAATMWRAYAGYLVIHGVEDGLRNYERTADLALRWLAEHGFPPDPLETR